MRTQTKIIFLLLLTLGILIVSSLFFQQLGKRQKQVFIGSQQQTLNSFVDYLLVSKKQKYVQLTKDYGTWDDMCNLINKYNKTWADENINRLTTLYATDYIWIYNTKNILLHSATDSNQFVIKRLPVDSTNIPLLFDKSRGVDFFVRTDSAIIQVIATTVHPTNDPERKTKPIGYFFLGRVWNESFIQELAQSSGCKVIISKMNPALKFDSLDNHVIVHKPIFDWQNKEIANIYFIKDNPFIAEWNKNSLFSILTAVVLSLLIITLFWVATVKWITLPLSIISSALQYENIQIGERLKRYKNEFGKIGVLIEQFFIQKQELRRYSIKLEEINIELEKLSIVASKTDNGIIIMDALGNIEWVNDAFTRLYSMTLEQWKKKYGRNITDSFHENSNLEKFAKCINNKESVIIDAENIADELENLWIQTSITPVIDNQGNITKLVAINTDITALKKAEQAILNQNDTLEQQSEELSALAEQLMAANDYIKESEQQLNSIIEFLPDPVFVINNKGTVIAWNKAMEELTNVLKEEMIGKGNFEYALIFYGERRPMLIDLIFESNENFSKYYNLIERKGDTLVGEAYVPYLRGSKYYLLGSASALYNSRNELIGTIETVRDITDKKKSEEFLQEANRQLSFQNQQINQQKEELMLQNELLHLHKEKIVLQNEKLLQQSEQILLQNAQITEQNQVLNRKNLEIKDSILYAENIQRALLPPNDLIKELLPDHLVFFKPRDVVSGDFYWVRKIVEPSNEQVILVMGDCTGHGVPGAFMSMLGICFLNEIVNKYVENNYSFSISASYIVNELRKLIKTSLHQTGKEGASNDGMDIITCVIDFENLKLQFAGALRPLIIIRKNTTLVPESENLNEIIEYKGDSMPVGVHFKERESFTNHFINLFPDDTLYLASDGFEDQLGGIKGKKFLSKYFKQLLLNIHTKPFAEQKEILNNTFEEWRTTPNIHNRKYFQLDDLLILGVRI